MKKLNLEKATVIKNGNLNLTTIASGEKAGVKQKSLVVVKNDAQRIEEFMRYIKQRKREQELDTMGSASSHLFGKLEAVDEIYKKAKAIFNS